MPRDKETHAETLDCFYKFQGARLYWLPSIRYIIVVCVEPGIYKIFVFHRQKFCQFLHQNSVHPRIDRFWCTLSSPNASLQSRYFNQDKSCQPVKTIEETSGGSMVSSLGACVPGTPALAKGINNKPHLFTLLSYTINRKNAISISPYCVPITQFQSNKGGEWGTHAHVVKTTVFPKCKFITWEEELQHGVVP